MAYRIQTVVDCHDPHVLADWWAETLGWVVEPSDPDFIRRMIAEGQATEEDTTEHHGVLVWRTGAAVTPEDQVGSPTRTRILFQAVPEPKSGKNRVHWDVHTQGADIDEVRGRLEARGATYVATHSEGPYSWHVMRDPQGNEFCVCP